MPHVVGGQDVETLVTVCDILSLIEAREEHIEDPLFATDSVCAMKDITKDNKTNQTVEQSCAHVYSQHCACKAKFLDMHI